MSAEDKAFDDWWLSTRRGMDDPKRPLAKGAYLAGVERGRDQSIGARSTLLEQIKRAFREEVNEHADLRDALRRLSRENEMLQEAANKAELCNERNVKLSEYWHKQWGHKNRESQSMRQELELFRVALRNIAEAPQGLGLLVETFKDLARDALRRAKTLTVADDGCPVCKDDRCDGESE